MKILPFTNIRAEVLSSSLRIKRASVYGYNVANRTASVYKQNEVKRMFNITRSVSSKVLEGTTRKELPYFACAVGLLIPIPLFSPILMGLGLFARSSMQGASMLYENQNKANTNLPIR